MHPFSGSALFSLKKIAGSVPFIVFCFMSVVFVFGYLLSVLWNAFLCCGFKCGSRGVTGGPDPPHASVFWFCIIFSEEDSWFCSFYSVLFHVCGLCVRISVERIVKCLFVLWLQVRIQRGDRGSVSPPPPPPPPPPPRKSQVIWVSTGNKQLNPPPPPPPPWKKLDPPGKCWNPSGTLKMIVFFGINHLTSVK